MARLDIISEKPQLGSRAVGDPQVEIAIVVPVDRGCRPRVVDEVQAAKGGNVGEPPRADV